MLRVFNWQLTGVTLQLNTSRIAANACRIKQDCRMDFLKAVLLAMLIHIFAPLVLKYADAHHWFNPSACVTTGATTALNGKGGAGATPDER